jgi:membrane protein
MSARPRHDRRPTDAGGARRPAGGRASLHRFRATGEALAVHAAPAIRAARGFGAARVQLRAAALTYLTVVSLVPFLAVVLYVLQVFDVFRVGEEVRTFVSDNLAVGSRGAVQPTLDRLVSNASRAGAVRIGFLLLVVSSVLLLRNIERAFDDLWGVGRRRPLSRQIPRYLGVILVGPIALGLSLAVTAAFRATVELYSFPGAGLVATLLPLVFSILGFATLFLLAPPARVQPKAALGGAVVAALAWEAAKVLYTAYAARSVGADVLYGPLGALPLFLVWIYVSWLITLFGARFAYALQHPREILAGSEEPATRATELAAARVGVALAAIADPEDAPTIHGLARSLRLPEATVRTALGHLEDAGLVRFDRRRPLLARPATQIGLGEVVRAVRGEARPPLPGADPVAASLTGLLGRADETALSTLEGRSLASLAADAGPGAPPAGGAPLAKA